MRLILRGIVALFVLTLVSNLAQAQFEYFREFPGVSKGGVNAPRSVAREDAGGKGFETFRTFASAGNGLHPRHPGVISAGWSLQGVSSQRAIRQCYDGKIVSCNVLAAADSYRFDMAKSRLRSILDSITY